MKNLLIYINPDGFDPESGKLARLQIDNSLELGWKKADLLLVTNFNFEYQDIKPTVLDDDTFCAVFKHASKINAIVRLFELGLIEKKVLYWFHDLDAYQNNPFTESELELGPADAGFTDYGRLKRWNAGSFFFKQSAREIFDLIKAGVYERGAQSSSYRHASEESVLTYLTENNIGGINKRIKRLNNTYNFGMRRLDYCYEKAVKPLKVLHFHPRNPLLNTLAIAMYGRNRIGKPLMSQRLIRLFEKYGYT